MSESTSVVNLGDLTKPATVLVERISDAVGGLFRPYQVVRMARAEAEAERIRAETGIEVTDLHRRAFSRFLHEEARKQAHIEEVTRLALPQLDQDAQPEQIEEDWLTNFFDKCRLTSDQQLQELWSRVLAGEANAPGRFSRRTVSFIASLDTMEAQRFTAICCFCWTFVGDTEPLVPLILDISDPIYEARGVTFSAIKDLAAIGLVSYLSLGGFNIDVLSQPALVAYFSEQVMLTLPDDANSKIKIGNVILTRTGQELASICGAVPVQGFFDYALGKWRARGVMAEVVAR
ncbi:MAG: DUF2806 domain-containing protein [Thermoanaerobaculia bacterium]